MVSPVLRQAAEQLHADELQRLSEADQHSGAELPPGWLRSPRAVRRFILGDDALGISRKFCMPLLDHLDGIGFTRRNGDRRLPGPLAAEGG